MKTLSKICLHWTAGSNKPCLIDLNSYHYCIDSNARIYKGKHKPEDNLVCTDNNYAAHCGGGNTGCIGLSVCGMAGFDLKNKKTIYPINQNQIEALCCLAGYMCAKYNISINESTVFTHYEFDQRQKKKKGKIDITYLPYLPSLSIKESGLYFRRKITWYKQKIQEGKYIFKQKGNFYEFICID